MISSLAGQDATEDYDMVHNAELVSETLQASACLGDFDTATVEDLKQPTPKSQPQTDTTQSKTELPPLSSIVSVNDFETVAQRYLTATGWAYYASGADDMYSIADNPRLVTKLLREAGQELRNRADAARRVQRLSLREVLARNRPLTASPAE